MTRQLSQSSFTVSVERHEPNVLHLHGALDAANRATLQTAIDTALASGENDVVLDLSELDVTGTPLFATVDAAAGAAAALGRRLMLRGSHDDLARIPQSTLALVHVEPTAALRVVARAEPGAERPARRDAASPGTPRREGAGFVSSYGQGRHCAVNGCPTMLSRYNPKDVCANHLTGRRD